MPRQDVGSAWNDPDWKDLVEGRACPICAAGEPRGVISELEISYLTAEPEAPMAGYVCLVLKRHVVELFDLTAGEGAALMRDIQATARVVKRLTNAVKINYEIHGNTIPHLHVHLYPRQIGDAFDGRPIDPRAGQGQPGPYAVGEFNAYVADLKSALRPTLLGY